MRVKASRCSFIGRYIPPFGLPLFSWIKYKWDIPLLLLFAAGLRFYHIHTTEFDDDQAQLYRLAYDAIHHGLLPATSNNASIGIAHAPGSIYFFLPFAALSANPLWGALLIACASTAAVLLTYCFTYRYYGRGAGLIAALLYGISARPLLYARFIWQPNLMPLFVVLFMFALFQGAVERRKGWFILAIVWLGILYQLHPTAILLLAPLVAAIMLAPGTIRWRDPVLAAVALLVIFSPYLVWQSFTHMADLQTLMALSKQRSYFDQQAIGLYRLLLVPFDVPPTFTRSVMYSLVPFLSWLRVVMPVLVVGGLVTAGIFLLHPVPRITSQPVDERRLHFVSKIVNWWRDFCATSSRCGVLVLLVWQIVPLILLSHHTVKLHPQYLFLLLPGPFILISLCLSQVSAWLQKCQGFRHYLRYGLYLLTGLLMVAQLLGGIAIVIDTSKGNFDDRAFYPYHNDLSSLQQAVHAADRVAQQQHLNHVYMTADEATWAALHYLAETLRTPVTIFDNSRCLVLPDPRDGPAVLLIGPYAPLAESLLSHFARATSIQSLPRLGGDPFRLYLVASPSLQTSVRPTFSNNLQLLDTRPHQLKDKKTTWLVLRWQMLHAQPPSFRTTYTYALTARTAKKKQSSACTFSAIRAGDLLLVAFGFYASTPVIVNAQSYITIPDNPYYGPLHLESSNTLKIKQKLLQTREKQQEITIVGS